jgi:hypothetical protein
MLERCSQPTPPPIESAPQTPTSESAELRTSGSSGKSTWKERNDPKRGTIVKEGDIGDGSVADGACQATLLDPCRPVLTSHRFSTVRPVKKVDEAASQRLSAEFIGTGSVRRMSQVAASGSTVKAPPQPESPTKPKQPMTARGKAGQVLVEQVMLGVLDTVSGTDSTVGPASGGTRRADAVHVDRCGRSRCADARGAAAHPAGLCRSRDARSRGRLSGGHGCSRRDQSVSQLFVSSRGGGSVSGSLRFGALS